MTMRDQLRGVPLGWALAVITVAIGALLVKAAGLAIVLAVVLVDRLTAALLAAADWADDRIAARAGVEPASRVGHGFSYTAGGAR